MNAYIKQDTKNSDALWLIVEREDKPAEIEGIMGILRTEDSAGNVAFPFLKDEIKLIKKACEDYLTSQKKVV
jgi:hypothetical protein